MGPRADSHDDVYDRQIRLWGADAQVSSGKILSPSLLLTYGALIISNDVFYYLNGIPFPIMIHIASPTVLETNVQCPGAVHQPHRSHLRSNEEFSIGRSRRGSLRRSSVSRGRQRDAMLVFPGGGYGKGNDERQQQRRRREQRIGRTTTGT